MPARSLPLRFAVLVPAVALVVVGTTLLGSEPLNWGAVLAWQRVQGAEPDLSAQIFWSLRVPRTLLAACVGAGLAVGGVVFQSLFRNPLAEPFTLGIASGASLAAAIGFLAGWGGTLAGGFPRL
ncbi:MAG: iron chelate uptake ABC transporter family permease subunit, partial [Planctomycetota bacterium]